MGARLSASIEAEEPYLGGLFTEPDTADVSIRVVPRGQGPVGGVGIYRSATTPLANGMASRSVSAGAPRIP